MLPPYFLKLLQASVIPTYPVIPACPESAFIYET